MKAELKTAFSAQAADCKRLGSAFNARVCRLFSKRRLPRGLVTDRIANWAGDPVRDRLPLRVMGALHGLVLERKSLALAQLYPSNDPQTNAPAPEDDLLWNTICDALTEHKLYFMSRLQLVPIHSLVSRSNILIAPLTTLARQTGLPLVLSELGCGAGFNLLPDLFRYEINGQTFGDAQSSITLTPQWTGDALAPEPLNIVERAGSDVHPLTASDRLDQQRLLSFIWPDLHTELAQARAALRLAAAQQVVPVASDPAPWLERRLAQTRPNAIHVVIELTPAASLNPTDVAQCEFLLQDAGATATTQSPLAWLRLQATGSDTGEAVVMTRWPGGNTSNRER